MEGSREDTNGIYDDAPETPAPLFAIRAFKQALFGTPKPNDVTVKRNQTQPRRNTRPSSLVAPDKGFHTLHPQQGRATAGQLEDVTPLTSPSKPGGILVTPGTTGKSRKTVSFNKNHPGGERKSTGLAKTPTTLMPVPGKFPSPAKQEQRKNRVCVTVNGDSEEEDLKAVEESVQATEDLQNPISPSGKYWKSVHECYTDKSQLDMLKLEKKEQIAKKFGRSKDEEVTQLKKELELERRKVEALETKLRQYVEQLEQPGLSYSPRDTEHCRSIHPKPERPRRRTSGTTGLTGARSKGIDPYDGMAPAARNRLNVSEKKSATVAAPEATTAARNIESSDVWKDLEGHASAAQPELQSSGRKAHLSQTERQRRSWKASTLDNQQTKERQPLSSTDGNAAVAAKNEQNSAIQATAKDDNDAKISSNSAQAAESGERYGRKASQMSTDRKEAAKKRLEERRKARLGRSEELQSTA